jgi:uncharacterized membrane protein
MPGRAAAAVDGAVDGAVVGAVDGAVVDAVDGAVVGAVVSPVSAHDSAARERGPTLGPDRHGAGTRRRDERWITRG